MRVENGRDVNALVVIAVACGLVAQLACSKTASSPAPGASTGIQDDAGEQSCSADPRVLIERLKADIVPKLMNSLEDTITLRVFVPSGNSWQQENFGHGPKVVPGLLEFKKDHGYCLLRVMEFIDEGRRLHEASPSVYYRDGSLIEVVGQSWE